MQDDEIIQASVEPSVLPPSALSDQADITTKKHTGLKTALIVIGAFVAVVIIVFVIIISVVFSLVSNHSNELSKLKKETISIFSESNVTTSSYYCRDVELRNMCSFESSVSNDEFKSYLLSKGFVESNAYGDGYKKGNLFIVKAGDSMFQSLYL